MYIIKNALKNIGRNKGRNILMAVIIFAIILTTAVSIIINTTTAGIINDYKARFGSEVSINFDWNNVTSASQYKELTAEQLIEFGKSDYLQNAVYTQNMPITFEKLHALDEDKEGFEMGMGSPSIEGGESQKQEETVKVLGVITATNKSEISDDFKNGLRKLKDGKFYGAKDECMVSRQFAELNNLSVGDSITVKSYLKNKPMAHTLKISGIYEDYTMNKENVSGLYQYMPSAYSNRNNEILVSFETAQGMEMAKAKDYTEVIATYFLKDPSMLSDYQKELESKGLPKNYKVTTDEASYNRIVGPVEGLSKITNTFLIVVLILGSAILILLSTLAIRERKYEVGVLRAMGMKKGKVAIGLLCEMLVITGICLVLGLGVGSVAAQPVADSMLQNQIEQTKDDFGGGDMAVIGSDNSTESEALSELKVSLSTDAVLQIALISLALAGVSSIVGILYITKYEPMKILSERN